ncbi:myb-like DNA-binding domain containing protein [Musa troglodytarum]|uniref:Myb-like DNA-binding domain containing protein n=1 Tax=Musa troglodytarum TaxID=320322 RepID=A0A9E7JB75_9LILI|nr:myb-like DNA-binding domain containing protein [Musa troglodytarum]
MGADADGGGGSGFSGPGKPSNGTAAAAGVAGPAQALKHNPGLSVDWSPEEQAILEEELDKIWVGLRLVVLAIVQPRFLSPLTSTKMEISKFLPPSLSFSNQNGICLLTGAGFSIENPKPKEHHLECNKEGRLLFLPFLPECSRNTLLLLLILYSAARLSVSFLF